MSDKTGIEWTRGDDGTPGATWNPTTGCDRVSPGCDNCYALTMAKRLKAMGSPRYQRDGNPATSGPGFGFTEHPDALDQPLRWTRPRRIFVNSMSDLFHSEMSQAFLARIWAVMALAPQHTFQVLTKRPGRMASILSSDDFQDRFAEALYTVEDPTGREVAEPAAPWPLPNVWVGTSVEDQKRAFRIEQLRRTPAAVRFLSLEPLLGPIDMSPHLDVRVDQDGDRWRTNAIDWVIVGGESGRGARPMDLDWVRSLRDQCVPAGVAFFYKQQGSGDGGPKSRRELDGRTWDEYPQAVTA